MQTRYTDYLAERQRREQESELAAKQEILAQLPPRESGLHKRRSLHRFLAIVGGLLVVWGSHLQVRYGNGENEST